MTTSQSIVVSAVSASVNRCDCSGLSIKKCFVYLPPTRGIPYSGIPTPAASACETIPWALGTNIALGPRARFPRLRRGYERPAGERGEPMQRKATRILVAKTTRRCSVSSASALLRKASEWTRPRMVLRRTPSCASTTTGRSSPTSSCLASAVWTAGPTRAFRRPAPFPDGERSEHRERRRHGK